MAQQAVGRELVLWAWRTLSLEQRQVLIQCHFDGASVAEAAETLGVTADTVKSRTYDALCNLRDTIHAMRGVC